MKRKLLSIVSVVLAMSMTTSAFAATARGTGDVDGDGKITANDVFKIMQNLAADDAQANVDGYTGIDGLDARVLYNTILQPKTVSEDLTLKAYSEGMANDTEFRVFDAADLASTTGHEAPNGLKEVATSVDTSTTTTIKDAIDKLVDMAANQRTQGITNQLNRIFFVSAVKGDVYLRSENGWAMFCNALRYIVPMDGETAALCNRPENGTPISEIEANETLKARYDALNEVKAIIVGDQEDPAAVNETALSASDIIAAKDALYRAIPSGLTDEEITATAKEVLKITDTKYVFSVDSEKTGQEDLSEANVDTSAFINGLLALKNYDTATMADYRNTFGDKLSIKTQNNVGVTFEVAVVAGVDSSEATTETPTESSTEAPTESSTEAPTETTTEAPVSGSWSFDISSLTAAADKEELTGSIGTDNFFTVVGEVTKRTGSSGDVSSIELAKAERGAIEFTVTGNAHVEFDASSTGGSNTSAIALVSADGTTYYVNTTVTGSANGRTTFTADVPAGTYRIISPLDAANDRGARVYSINVTA
mgnify:FL=1